MHKQTAFIHVDRQAPKTRPVHERVRDWRDVYTQFTEETVRTQASRCMDCGIPFCHEGCPLGNLIPEWNSLVYKDRWRAANDRLHLTNPFPEFTGKICPAPCEPSCVLSINSDPVTIKAVELSIIDRAFHEGWVRATPPPVRTGKKVAVVGSGPAGLAAAHGLNRLGHSVTVFERADRIGGLLRYGIPEFKLEKWLLDRRLRLLAEEGVEFRTDADVGGALPVEDLRREYDAVVLAIGSTAPRDIPIPGRELGGIHLAMDYLTLANRRCEGDYVPEEEFISAEGKHVVIIGGGDTGADCLGTAHRQRAASVVQLWLYPEPPRERPPDNPWPQWPRVFRATAAHEEGGELEYRASTEAFIGEGGRLRALSCVRVEAHRDADGRARLTRIPGSEFEIPADLVLIAVGYSGPERPGPVQALDLALTDRGNIAVDARRMTSAEGVFAAGDATRGQSLVVWAIAEGREVVHGVDEYLMG